MITSELDPHLAFPLFLQYNIQIIYFFELLTDKTGRYTYTLYVTNRSFNWPREFDDD